MASYNLTNPKLVIVESRKGTYVEKMKQVIRWMIFFPFESDNKFYIACFNLKLPYDEILEPYHIKDSWTCGNTVVRNLKNLMTRHLRIVGHPESEKVIRLGRSDLGNDWPSSEDSDDVGIFMMRITESYLGYQIFDMRCCIHRERRQRTNQMELIRRRFLQAIISSKLNSMSKNVKHNTVEYIKTFVAGKQADAALEVKPLKRGT